MGKITASIVSRGTVLAALVSSMNASSAAHPRAALADTVAIVPIKIESLPFRNAPERADLDAALLRLGEEATARAERTLLQQRIAEHVVRTSTSMSGPDSGPRMVLTGVVRLPVSLPPGEGGSRAVFRKGRFLTAHVVLQRTDGPPMATADVTLDWDDVDWLRGVRIRRARPTDEVLGSAVRKAVDRAVKRLKDQVRPQAAETGDEMRRLSPASVLFDNAIGSHLVPRRLRGRLNSYCRTSSRPQTGDRREGDET